MKSAFKVTNIDLYSMSKGVVDTSGNKKKKKKKKVIKFNKNLFTLGFEPGFTKALIKANFVNISRKKKEANKVNLIFNKATPKKNIKKNKK